MFQGDPSLLGCDRSESAALPNEVGPTQNTHPIVFNTHPSVPNTHPSVPSTHPSVSNTHPSVSNTHPSVSNTHPSVYVTQRSGNIRGGRAIGECRPPRWSMPLFSEYDKHDTVTARFWPWRSGKSPLTTFHLKVLTTNVSR